MGTTCNLYALLVLVILCMCSAGPLVASKNPVQLILKRVSIRQNETTLQNGDKGYTPVTEPSEKKPRSRPLLFQQALDLEPGKPYVFNYPKWRMLESCGLFRNLSATTRSQDGQLTTIVTGTELPSITFSPSVQLGASLENPEINGGVLLRDNNFRGLGERFELIVSAFKEGLEKGVGELPPSFTVKWIDGIKGRPNSVTACWDEDYGLEDAKDLTLRVLSSSASKRIQVMKRNVKVTFDGMRTLGDAAGDFFKGSGVTYSVEPFQCETKPLHVDKSVESSTLSGAKIAVTHYPKPSLKWWPSIGITHEVGINTRGSGAKDKYQTLGVDVTSQNMVIKETITAPGTKTTPPQGHITFAKLKLKNLLTRGEGRVPLLHLANFDDPRNLRGYNEDSAVRFGASASASGALSNRKRAFSVLKAEVQNSGIVEWGIPGVFLDAALFRDAVGVGGSDGCENSWGLRSAAGLSAQMAAGLSVKSSGFRLDLAWPLRRAGIKPRLYLGPDTGDL